MASMFMFKCVTSKFLKRILKNNVKIYSILFDNLIIQMIYIAKKNLKKRLNLETLAEWGNFNYWIFCFLKILCKKDN